MYKKNTICNLRFAIYDCTTNHSYKRYLYADKYYLFDTPYGASYICDEF